MFVLDGVVALLLIVCIIYCMKLNKKIMALHRNKNDFAKGIKYFDDAILRAETSIVELRNVSTTVVVDLHDTINKAQNIISDLSFMVDRAANLTDKLEISITDARTLIAPPTSPYRNGNDRGNDRLQDSTSGNAAMKSFQAAGGRESENARTMALQSLLERISAAKNTHSQREASTQFGPPAASGNTNANSSKNLLKTLRSLSREDPI
jgi:hypothetical protein